MSLVRIRDVRKSFGANEVLKGVSLDIAKGDVVAIIGRSGSGKSTLLRCINGLETYQSGAIVADGIEVGGASTNLRELRRHVGMVFQQFNLFPHLTAAENVMLAPTVVNKVSKAEARATAAEVLAKVGLSEKVDAYPSELSGGQQQRVAIARSLAMRPKVLLCDEITSALDPELVNEVLRVVEQLAREGLRYSPENDECLMAAALCETARSGARPNEGLAKLLQAHPESLSSVHALVVALVDAGRISEAHRIARSALRGDPANLHLVSLVRELHIQNHWSMKPLWPLQKWGWGASAAMWLGGIVVIRGLS